MLPELPENPMPAWLADAKLEDPIPIRPLLSGSVFYPASGFDGRPVKYLAGFSHSFVCADWCVSRQEVLANLDSFKGYRLLFSRFVEKNELCFNSYRAIPFKTTYYMGECKQTTDHPQHIRWPSGFQPFAEWAVYERLSEFGKDHGPERFSLLFVGGEGVKTFQELYLSNNCTPSTLVLLKCDAFTGNWTQFYDPQRILAKCVMQNPAGSPEYLLVDYGDISPWPAWFSIPIKTFAQYRSKLSKSNGLPCEKLVLWKRSEEARTLHERALAIQEQDQVYDHPDTATSLYDLATLFSEPGNDKNLEAARPLYERALAIREKALGPEHPATVLNRDRLAECLCIIGDHTALRPLYEHALAISGNTCGSYISNTICRIDYLIRLLEGSQDFAAAHHLYKHALMISEGIYGAEHRKTAISIFWLAFRLYDNGDYATARPLFERSLDILERTSEIEDAETLEAKRYIAMCLRELGQHKESQLLFRGVLEARSRILGIADVKIALIQAGLGRSYRMAGDVVQARKVLDDALERAVSSLGEDHEATRGILEEISLIGAAS